jgi:hypothetical protein
MGECRTFGLTGSSGGELNVDGIQTVEALFGGRQGVVCSQPGKIEKLLPGSAPVLDEGNSARRASRAGPTTIRGWLPSANRDKGLF